MSDFKNKPNEAFCFAKEGFQGFSGKIVLDTGAEYWITVYDNEGKKVAYKAVKLKPAKPKTDKPVADHSRNLVDNMDDGIPF